MFWLSLHGFCLLWFGFVGLLGFGFVIVLLDEFASMVFRCFNCCLGVCFGFRIC